MNESLAMGPYAPLFRIDMHHAYFADRRCRHLAWGTGPGSKAMLDNLGLLFRVDDHGAAVYYDTGRTDALSLFALQAGGGESDLFFKIYSGDPYFLNYTDLPGYSKNSVIYLDAGHAVADSGEDFRLHSQPYVSAQEHEPLPALPDHCGLTRNDRGAPPLGVIRIPLVGDPRCPLDPKGNIQPKCYRAGFQSRCTHWKYNVCGHWSSEPILVEDADHQWKFKALPAQKTSGTDGMRSFMSSAPIPLQHEPVYTFQLKLKLKSKAAARLLIKKLPVAPVNMVHRETFGGKMVYTSEIFIHA